MEFPTSLDYRGEDLAGLIHELLEHSIPEWQKHGLVEATGNFAVVVANLTYAGHYSQVWNNPLELVGCAYGSPGVDWWPYAWKALCKMRASARIGMSSLVLTKHTGLFKDVVNPDMLVWGDYPQPGAAFTGLHGPTQVLVGVDGFTPYQNHWIAGMVGGFLEREMVAVDTGNEAA